MARKVIELKKSDVKRIIAEKYKVSVDKVEYYSLIGMMGASSEGYKVVIEEDKEN